MSGAGQKAPDRGPSGVLYKPGTETCEEIETRDSSQISVQKNVVQMAYRRRLRRQNTFWVARKIDQNSPDQFFHIFLSPSFS
jgi:hypothetical protein